MKCARNYKLTSNNENFVRLEDLHNTDGRLCDPDCSGGSRRGGWGSEDECAVIFDSNSLQKGRISSEVSILVGSVLELSTAAEEQSAGIQLREIEGLQLDVSLEIYDGSRG